MSLDRICARYEALDAFVEAQLALASIAEETQHSLQMAVVTAETCQVYRPVLLRD